MYVVELWLAKYFLCSLTIILLYSCFWEGNSREQYVIASVPIDTFFTVAAIELL